MSHIAKNVRVGTLQCFRKFRFPKMFLHKKGMALIAVENFWCHNTGNYRGGTLQCFPKILASKKLLDKTAGGRVCEYHGFPSSFLSHSTENFRRGNFCEYHGFPSSFLSHSTENFRRGNFFRLRRIMVSRNFVDRRRGVVSRSYVECFWSLSAQKILGDSLPGLKKFRVSKNFMYEKRYH